MEKIKRMKNKRLKLLLLLLSFICAGLMSACSEKRQQLTVGISPWPGYEAVLLGVENGLFEPLDVKVIRFATPTESFKALRNGVVDIASFTVDEVFRFAETETLPQIFMVIDVSNGGDAVVAKKNISSLADLKGKRVVTETSALGDYMFQRMLDFSTSLTKNDIFLSSSDIGEQLKLFVEDKVDAAVTYEPFKSQMIKAGGHVVFDSTQIPYEIVDVFVTNQQQIEEKYSSYQLFVSGWFRTLDYINEHYDQAMQKMASYERVDVKTFQSAYEQLIIPDLQQNKTLFGNSEKSLEKPLRRLSSIMLAKGNIKKQVNIKEIIAPKLVMEHNSAPVD